MVTNLWMATDTVQRETAAPPDFGKEGEFRLNNFLFN
jgi:hypothetical protein